VARSKSRQLLRVGYVWQSETADMTTISASVLHITAVIRALEKRGHQVRLITFWRGRPHWSDDLQKWHPIQAGGLADAPAFRLFERVVRGTQSRLHLPFLRLFDSYRFAEACAAATSGCDLLYERFWLMASGGLMAAKRLRIPLIYEVNGDLVEEYRQVGIKLSRAQWAAIHFLTRRMFRAAHVVTVSETLKQTAVARWRLDPARVDGISNGAHTDAFARPDGEQVDRTRAQYGLNGSPIIMFVGTFKPWHGLDLLLDAFSQVVFSLRQEARLVLVGDGPLREELQQKVATLHLTPYVTFTGIVPHEDVPALLAAADIAVVNPRLTGASASQSPLKLFEYMAAGKAIVAPTMPNVEQVLKHGENGYLVPPDHCDSLAHGLAQLLEDGELRRAMGQAARQQALARHSWEKTVAEIEGIMYRLLQV
jgi:glycosyltransferase involved in cell wall biosynthesis